LALIKKDAVADANVVTFFIKCVNEKCFSETVDTVSRMSLSLRILVIKANKMLCFSTSFGKELYIFQTGLLSIIRSLNTVYTAIGICHASYVDCLLARSG